MAAEVLYVAAQDNDMPRFLRRATPDDLPVPALVMSTVLVQVVLIITLFSDDAFNFALDLTSTLTLIPFLLAAAFALKISLMHDPLAQRERTGRELLATLQAFLLYAAGPRFILLSFIIYAPATILFVMARREQGRRLFSPGELVICAVSIVGALMGVTALAAGWISL